MSATITAPCAVPGQVGSKINPLGYIGASDGPASVDLYVGAVKAVLACAPIPETAAEPASTTADAATPSLTLCIEMLRPPLTLEAPIDLPIRVYGVLKAMSNAGSTQGALRPAHPRRSATAAGAAEPDVRNYLMKMSAVCGASVSAETCVSLRLIMEPPRLTVTEELPGLTTTIPLVNARR